MRTPRAPSLSHLGLLAGLVALAMTTGLAFAGWMDHGARIFQTMAETGLAWCF